MNVTPAAPPLNEVAEGGAIKQVLGELAYYVPISGTKAMLGHPLGASGAIEAAICMLAFRHADLPPTLNLEEPAPSQAAATIRRR